MSGGSCSKCGVEHSRFKDADHKVPASYCADCHAAYMREHRPKHSELPALERLKSNCRAYSNVYQRRGKLAPGPCERCGDPAEKHHDDYSQPLQVRWLCRPCHLELHREAV